jgi:DNA invertase Pin-like site-specific DNA recombinase
VYFEKENLDSTSIQSEFILSTIAAIAQEESRSISENLRLAYKTQERKGATADPRHLRLSCQPSDQERPADRDHRPDEAETVRYIYAEYLRGQKLRTIADNLMTQGKTKHQRRALWHGRDGQSNSGQREVRRRCAHPENLHGRLPYAQE